MNACIGVGRLDEASALLEAAVAAGVRLDARAYNVLLKGHARAGNPASLASIMEQMQRAQVRTMPLALQLARWHAGPLACTVRNGKAQPFCQQAFCCVARACELVHPPSVGWCTKHGGLQHRVGGRIGKVGWRERVQDGIAGDVCRT